MHLLTSLYSTFVLQCMGGSNTPHVVYILKPCSHVKCADSPCSNFHKPQLWSTRFRAWRVSTLDRFQQAEACSWASYTTSQLDCVLWWFMGNPTRGCLFRPGGIAKW